MRPGDTHQDLHLYRAVRAFVVELVRVQAAAGRGVRRVQPEAVSLREGLLSGGVGVDGVDGVIGELGPQLRCAEGVAGCEDISIRGIC